jgi:hypothetical protein
LNQVNFIGPFGRAGGYRISRETRLDRSSWSTSEYTTSPFDARAGALEAPRPLADAAFLFTGAFGAAVARFAGFFAAVFFLLFFAAIVVSLPVGSAGQAR